MTGGPYTEFECSVHKGPVFVHKDNLDHDLIVRVGICPDCLNTLADLDPDHE